MLLLVTAGGWFMNRWLQSAEAHAKIEGKLSEALKMPVKIEVLGFSAWSGLTAKKITVSGPDGILFEADGMSASHSFFALLRGSVGLSEVRMRRPHIRIFQDATGHWGPRRTAAPPQPAVAAAPAVAPQPAPQIAAQPVQPANPPPAIAHASEKQPAISIGKILIENGTVEMFGKTRAPFATVTGLNVMMSDVTETAFSGSVAIGRATLHGWVAIDKLTGTTTRDGQTFSMRDLIIETGGGTITGEGAYTIGATATAALKFVAVSLARATQDGGMTGQKISGTVSGDAQFAGLGADKKLITGNGTFSLKGGDCSQFEALRQIGDVLRITMLANFQIGDATANFQIANEQVTLAPMEIVTHPISLTFTGPVAFDGTLNLTAFMSAPADMVAAQPLLAGNFSPPDARNRRSVPFHITGPMKKPRQDLADALTGTKNHREQNIIAGASFLMPLLQRNNPKLMQKLAPALKLVKPTLDRVIPDAQPAPEPR